MSHTRRSDFTQNEPLHGEACGAEFEAILHRGVTFAVLARGEIEEGQP